MTDAPKRRAWFQLHLSTSIVLMLAAGALVWANFMLKIEAEMPPVSMPTVVVTYNRGWPRPMQTDKRVEYIPVHFGDRGPTAYFESPWVLPENLHAGLAEYQPEFERLLRRPGLFEGEWSISRCALNAAVATGLLILTAALCEAWLRRRARAAP